ncbi:hypothetical protein HOO65_011212 [Ceratocystis lukuohia]|uniref:Uncharacterized protein n=1 Tax=Ceratocystis lukuohia TaxID=2019550 RepID=A0ABR4MUB3_9PEZI
MSLYSGPNICPVNSLFALDLALNVSNISFIQQLLADSPFVPISIPATISTSDNPMKRRSSHADSRAPSIFPAESKPQSAGHSDMPMAKYFVNHAVYLRLPLFQMKSGSWERVVETWIRELIILNSHAYIQWSEKLVLDAGSHYIHVSSKLTNFKRKAALRGLETRRANGKIARIIDEMIQPYDHQPSNTEGPRCMVMCGTSQVPRECVQRNQPIHFHTFKGWGPISVNEHKRLPAKQGWGASRPRPHVSSWLHPGQSHSGSYYPAANRFSNHPTTSVLPSHGNYSYLDANQTALGPAPRSTTSHTPCLSLQTTSALSSSRNQTPNLPHKPRSNHYTYRYRLSGRDVPPSRYPSSHHGHQNHRVKNRGYKQAPQQQKDLLETQHRIRTYAYLSPLSLLDFYLETKY